MANGPDVDLLASNYGCPFESTTAEAVIWLHGYREGLLRALDDVRKRLERQKRRADADAERSA